MTSKKLLEFQLPASNHRDAPVLGHVLEDLPDAVLLLDHNWRLLFANGAARKLSGLSRDQMNRETLWELFPEIVGTPLERKFRESLQSGETRYEKAFYHPAFDTWYELSIIPVGDELAVHYRDITQAQQAKLARAATDEQLTQVLEATTDCVVSLDRDYRIVYMNRRAREFLSPNGELIGKNMWQAFPKASYEGSPFEKYYHLAMDEGISCEFDAYYPAPLDKWLHIVPRPVKDGIVVFFRDITERKREFDAIQKTSAELAESQARLSAIYSGTFEYMGLLSPDGTLLECNRASLQFADSSRDEIIGSKFWDAPWFIFTPGAPERIRSSVERAAQGEFIRYEISLAQPNGEIVTFDFSLCPIRNESGEVKFLVPEFRDIRDLKRTQDALIQTEKLAAVGRLASSIAHEINNPLEAITNLLYLAQQGKRLPPETCQYLDMADRELRRVSVIASQTLRFHRQPTKAQPVNSSELIAPVIALYEGRLQKHAIRVHTRNRSNKPVNVFEGEIRQVLANLVVNAVDAMPEGGSLLLRSREATDWKTGRRGTVITVADTGGGIDPKALKDIFEPFFTTKGTSGTGLGLWISNEIVKRHHGRLRVRSSQCPPHGGTVFALFLPSDGVPRN